MPNSSIGVSSEYEFASLRPLTVAAMSPIVSRRDASLSAVCSGVCCVCSKALTAPNCSKKDHRTVYINKPPSFSLFDVFHCFRSPLLQLLNSILPKTSQVRMKYFVAILASLFLGSAIANTAAESEILKVDIRAFSSLTRADIATSALTPIIFCKPDLNDASCPRCVH